MSAKVMMRIINDRKYSFCINELFIENLESFFFSEDIHNPLVKTGYHYKPKNSFTPSRIFAIATEERIRPMTRLIMAAPLFPINR